MAEISKELGKYDEARSYARQGINSIHYTRMRMNEVNCHLLLGELELEQKNYREALDWLYSSERIAGYAADYQTPQGGLVFGRIYDRMEQAMSGIPDYNTSIILNTGMKSYISERLLQRASQWTL